MSIRAAAACSEHPVVAEALGECAGTLLEAGADAGSVPDLLLIGCTPPVHGALDDVVSSLARLLSPRCVAGAVATGLLGGGRVVEDAAALSVMALWGLPCRGVEVDAIEEDTLDALRRPGEDLFLVADPFSVAAGVLTASEPGAAGRGDRDGTVLAGLTGAGRRPGANRLVSNSGIRDHGAVGVALPGGSLDVRTATGVHPVGPPAVVTGAGRSRVTHLDGVSAREHLEALMGAEPDVHSDDWDLVLLVAPDDTVAEFDRDRATRTAPILPAPDGTSLHVDDAPSVGSVVCVARFDRRAAEAALSASLVGLDRAPTLVMAGDGRRAAPTGRPSDAELVSDATGGAPLWGLRTVGLLAAGRGRSASVDDETVAVGTLH